MSPPGSRAGCRSLSFVVARTVAALVTDLGLRQLQNGITYLTDSAGDFTDRPLSDPRRWLATVGHTRLGVLVEPLALRLRVDRVAGSETVTATVVRATVRSGLMVAFVAPTGLLVAGDNRIHR